MKPIDSPVGFPVRRRLPAAALFIIFFEFCERFGFYSMLSLLALFLVADRSTGGFGWALAPAMVVIGAYSGLMYGLPMLGGFVADRFLGHRRAIMVGGSAMLTGYLLLSSLGSLPLLAEIIGEPGLQARLIEWRVPLGHWTVPATTDVGLGTAYALFSLSFWLALVALVIGNALVKSTLVVMFGDSFADNPERRDEGYGLYYMAINLGGLLAGILSGLVARQWGWHIAFGMSGGAMAIALLGFAFTRRPAAQVTPKVADGLPADVEPETQRNRYLLLLVFAALLFVFSAGSFQLWGTMMVFLETGIDRRAGSFEIPAPWFTSLNAATLILTAPAFAAFWALLARRGCHVSIAGRYIIALCLGAAGLIAFGAAALMSDGAARAGWTLPAIAVVLLAMGEVAAWTSTYGLVYRLAPKHAVAATMGAYYAATLGLGGYVAGWLGGFAEPMGAGRYFLTFGLMTLAVAVATLLARQRLHRMMLATKLIE